ncbi:T9SS type A sorting domain-containing protein [Aureisphaera galaxeae]|uniref:VPS10 domain-containing protein n=1 Tax=Aureisphaera galaxeae TaxID=1538023 RepID=UPI00235103ED|nr:T9SS type A sorting domain-containing protein [Aureisphaera galaxeae]MDC8005111.1 T9SS type A sorting domain-containing protein [Aureisphaera galaxeae]
MKKLLLSMLFLVVVSNSYAQEYLDMIQKGTYTVREIQQKAKEYFDLVGTGKGTGFKQYKRWEYDALRSMDERGYLTSPEAMMDEFYRARQQNRANGSGDSSHWEELGPTTWNPTSSWGPGVGRVTTFAVDPSNRDHIIVGSSGGGVWRTVDSGSTWTALSDSFVNMYVYSLAIHPTNKDVYYWGSASGIIFVSADAGSTWNELVNLAGSDVNKILIDPSDPSTVFCSIEGGGIFRSTNSGATWSGKLTSESTGYDLEFKPGDPNTVYASGNSFYRSTNGGASFTKISSSFSSSQTKKIGVSADDSSVVYVVEEDNKKFGGLFKSTNSGTSFTELNHTSKNYFGYSDTAADDGKGQAPRNMQIAVNPANVDEVHIAGIYTWRSMDGGDSFSLSSYKYSGYESRNVGYCHQDINATEFIGDKMYLGTDGGIYVVNNPSGTIDTSYFTNMTFGMGIRQLYKIGVSQTHPEIVLGGAQDNGVAFYNTSGNWFDWLGADGMECFIDKDNNNIFYGSVQRGSLYKSTDGGQTRTGLVEPSGSGSWVTPFEQDPTDSDVIYVAFEKVHKSTNGGSSWTAISQDFGASLDYLKIAPSDNDIMYASENGSLYKTTNGGATDWTALSGYGGTFINDVAIHPQDPNRLAIATNNTNRVFVSDDGGATWTAKKLNLPSYRVYALVWENSSHNRLFAGMDYGIYYLDDSISQWQIFSNDLPNVKVNELEIHASKGVLYAATYGRGVFRTPLPAPVCSSKATSLPYAESFETQGNLGLWSQATGDDGNWTQHSGATPSEGTGPNAASEGSRYLYLESSNSGVGSNASAILDGPCIDASLLANSQLTFDYHAYGSTASLSGASIKVQGSLAEGLWFDLFSTPTTLTSQNTWMPVSVDLSNYDRTLKLRVVGRTGNGWKSDLAIDNFRIKSDCTSSLASLPYSEDFETQGALGHWIQITGDDGDWTQHTGATPSNDTGPSSASEGSRYLYLEASNSGMGANATAILEGPCVGSPLLSGARLIFDYHAFGTSATGASIKVQGSTTEGVWFDLFATPSTLMSEDLWIPVSVDLSSYNDDIKLRFVGKTGPGWSSDLALDNIRIHENPVCELPIPLLPHAESFETQNNFGLWSQTTGDDGDWTQHTGATPTSSTGPSAASHGGQYLYLESSSVSNGGIGYNATAIINGPCVEAAMLSDAQLMFDYHAYGSSISDASLKVQASTIHGVWFDLYTTPFPLTSQNVWISASVDLSNYNQDLKLRFVGKTGASYRSDLAIDNIEIVQTQQASVATTPILTIGEGKSLSEIAVYPNPTSGMVFMESTSLERIIKAELLDMQGRTLKTILVNDGKGSIDISSFGSATYLLKISTESNGEIIKRIIKR